jgi:hypothetical protein
MATNGNISGAIAHQPVVWWPNMSEFSDISYRNEIIKRNSIYNTINSFPPRPVLIQTGYMDERVGPYALDKLTTMFEEEYTKAAKSDKFTKEVMGIPGHSGWVPEPYLDSVPNWMEQNGFL